MEPITGIGKRLHVVRARASYALAWQAVADAPTLTSTSTCTSTSTSTSTAIREAYLSGPGMLFALPAAGGAEHAVTSVWVSETEVLRGDAERAACACGPPCPLSCPLSAHASHALPALARAGRVIAAAAAASPACFPGGRGAGAGYQRPTEAVWHWRSAESSLLPIPVIGSIARGDQRLNCSMRGSMEPRIEQFSR